jgi:Ca-activated chloride channel family protein
VDLARGAASGRVTTTCIGFGAQFNEDLLREMATAGGANYWYVERDDQMAAIFDEEIEGLVALAAQNLEVEIKLSHAAVAGVTFLQRYPMVRTPDGGFRVTIGDLYATSPRALGMFFHVNDVGALGRTQVAEVSVTADVLKEGGVSHEKVTLPVVANLDGTDHVEPVVERTFVRFEAAKAREEAIRQADAGDMDAAAAELRRGYSLLEPFVAEPGVAEEIEDLKAESLRMEQRKYEAADRKYHLSRSAGAHEGRATYLATISRRRPPKKPKKP